MEKSNENNTKIENIEHLKASQNGLCEFVILFS